MPKKSRRDRKRAPQQATASVSSPGATFPKAADIPELQLTDFSAKDATQSQSAEPESSSSPTVAQDQPPAQTAEPQPLGEQPGNERTLRRVQRKTATAAPAPAPKAPQITAVSSLPPESAAIPLSQVPYVPSDLRRVAFSALVIIIVIVVGGLLVTNAIH